MEVLPFWWHSSFRWWTGAMISKIQYKLSHLSMPVCLQQILKSPLHNDSQVLNLVLCYFKSDCILKCWSILVVSGTALCFDEVASQQLSMEILQRRVKAQHLNNKHVSLHRLDCPAWTCSTLFELGRITLHFEWLLANICNRYWTWSS